MNEQKTLLGQVFHEIFLNCLSYRVNNAIFTHFSGITLIQTKLGSAQISEKRRGYVTPEKRRDKRSTPSEVAHSKKKLVYAIIFIEQYVTRSCSKV